MRPDRLILGEMRDEVALAFLEAIFTGHPGSIFTIHANSPALALDRLAFMVMRIWTRLTRADVLEYGARTIDLIVQVGRVEGRRGVEEVFMPALDLKIGAELALPKSKAIQVSAVSFLVVAPFECRLRARNQLASEEIGGGHAFERHVPRVDNPAEFDLPGLG